MKKLLLLLTLAATGSKINAQQNPLCFVNTLTVSSNSPSQVETADFNGDGNMDFAFASYNGNTVSLFLGNGTGGFSTTSYTTGGSNLLGLTKGDFNNDGKPDVATANHFTGAPEMSVLLNNGNGTFAASVNYTVGAAIPESGRGICSGDFNYDGNTDLAIAFSDNGTGYLGIFAGNGTGTFTSSVTYSAVYPQSIISGRFNNDLYDDIAIANGSGSSIQVFSGSFSGIFSTPTSYPMSAINMCTADFNNDGFTDIANNDGVLLGSASGTFLPLYSYTISATGLAAADFDGDGNKDLALNQTLSNGLSIMKGLGNGYFGTPVTYTINSISLSETASADFNNDNKSDIVVGSGISQSTGSIFLNRTFSIIAAASPTSVCAGSNVTLSVTGGAISYSWSTGPITSTVNVTPSAGTVYSVTGLNTGCSNTQTISVNVITPTVNAIASATAVCTGFTSTLSVTGANTYSWSTGATSSVITVTPSANTVYSITGFDSGCSTTKTLSVLVNALPVLTFSVQRVSICAGDPMTITVSGANSYTWGSGAQEDTIIVIPMTLYTATYSVTALDINGCKSSGTVTEMTAICDGINEYKNNRNNLNVHPNPSAGIFYINDPSTTRIEIFDGTGQLILTRKQDGLLIDLSEKPNGIYFIRTYTATGEMRDIKLIKQN